MIIHFISSIALDIYILYTLRKIKIKVILIVHIKRQCQGLHIIIRFWPMSCSTSQQSIVRRQYKNLISVVVNVEFIFFLK